MIFSKPTISLEGLSKECKNVLINPFKGVRSTVNINKGIGLCIDNINCKSNISFLYSTNNFLSSIFIDDFSNIIFKNIIVYEDLVSKNVLLLNNIQPHMDFTLQMNRNILTTLNIAINNKMSHTCSFITKIEDSHVGMEINLQNKYESAFFYRLEKFKSIFSTIIKYDVLKLSFFQKINEKLSLANETVITDQSILSRMAILISSHCTDLRIEVNTLFKLLFSIEKRIFDTFSVNICTEMAKFGVFDIGLGLNLEI